MPKRRKIEEKEEEKQVIRMTEEIEAMIDNTLELSAVFVKLTHEKA